MAASSKLVALRRSLFALAALLGSAGALALDPGKRFHDYVRDGWSIEQGLPQISALAIAQDRDGYLWVGTQVGLARFDGHRFLTFTAGSEPGLPGGFINRLLGDRRGRIWVATYKGLSVRDGGRFRAVPLRDNPTAALDISALAELADGSLRVAAGQALYAVEDGQLVPRQELPGPVRSLLAEPETLWVGSRGGVYRLRGDEPPVFLPLPEGAGNAGVGHLLRAQSTLWAGTSEGLFQLEGERFAFVQQADALRGVPIEGLLEDRDGNLWVAELAHLSRLRSGRLQERIDDTEVPLSIRALFEDREGNLWLGSQWNGLSRLRDGWTRRFSLREGLHTPLLWSLADAGPGKLWVGTDDGLSLFDGQRFRQVLPGSALPHPNAYTLLPEGDAVWIGTRRGLARWQDGRLDEPAVFAGLRGAQINGLLRETDGSLWVASTDGLYRLRGATLDRFGSEQGLADTRVRQLLRQGEAGLLVGTHSGLFRLGESGFAPVGADQGLPPGLDVSALHALPGGRLVLGTLGEEVYYFDRQRWHRFGPEQGLPANAPFFFADHAGVLWIAGIRGVQQVALEELEALAAGRADRIHALRVLNERGDRRGGQKGFCCNGAGHAKGLLRDGELWAPTRDGLVAIDLARAGARPQSPTTLVERWRVGDQWRVLGESAPAPLPASARDIAFEFTAISFQDPRSVGFRYRLQGYDADWREPDEADQRVVAYTNLPGGHYRLEVQAAVADDAWGVPAELPFEIERRFRETAAFQALLVGLAVLLGLLGYRWQQHRYTRRAAALERLVQRRTEDLAEANRRLQEASHSDPLTGLRNRRYLALQIPKDLAFYGRELRRPHAQDQVLVFALLDIDHFKRINDEYGHAAGDRVLQQFAMLLQQQVRTGDYVARWGGEEFLVVFRPTPQDHVPMLGERVRAATAACPFDIGGGRVVPVTCSIGLVEYPLFRDENDSLSWEQLIDIADRALYEVKRRGRNGWAAYRPRPGASLDDIGEALRGDEAHFAERAGLDLLDGVVGLLAR